MNIEADDISLLACELTEEFLKTLPQLATDEKRSIRSQALPMICAYLSADTLSSLHSSAFLFRTALKEDTSFERGFEDFSPKKCTDEFRTTDGFETLMQSMSLPENSSRNIETEVGRYLHQYVINLKKNVVKSYALFDNSLTGTQDAHNHKILTRTAQDLLSAWLYKNLTPLKVLNNILEHTTHCQRQLHTQPVSVGVAQWTSDRREATDPTSSNQQYKGTI